MAKGMRVLELFNEHVTPLSIGDIADHTQMGRSAAQRYVYTLHQLGYLNKDTESKRYFPALKLLSLVRGIQRHHSQRELAYPLRNRRVSGRRRAPRGPAGGLAARSGCGS